jgi:hypothetical protein
VVNPAVAGSPSLILNPAVGGKHFETASGDINIQWVLISGKLSYRIELGEERGNPIE